MNKDDRIQAEAEAWSAIALGKLGREVPAKRRGMNTDEFVKEQADAWARLKRLQELDAALRAGSMVAARLRGELADAVAELQALRAEVAELRAQLAARDVELAALRVCTQSLQRSVEWHRNMLRPSTSTAAPGK